jgi:hypothetical protein
MSGMHTPATSRNGTTSRSGLDSAGCRAQRPTLTRRWLGCSGVAAGAGSTGGEIGGGATDAPIRAAPPPGPAAVLLPRTQTPGSNCRSLDPVGPWPPGERAGQPTSARHGWRTTRSQRGDIRGHPRDARPQTPRWSCKGAPSRLRLRWMFVAHPSRPRSPLLHHGQCFVPPAASASRHPLPSADANQQPQEGGRTTPGKYLTLHPDRVTLCGKGRGEASPVR